MKLTLQSDRLEEISTKEYEFLWPVAINGYEWHERDMLTFDPELHYGIYGGSFNSTAQYRNPVYNPDEIFMRLSTKHVTKDYLQPEPINTKAPWIAKKGDLALSQLQDPNKVPPSKWMTIPERYYLPLSIKTLHRQFANLATDNLKKEILGFANKYGFLGRTITLATPSQQKSAVVDGESLYLWCKEIEKFGVLLAIWDLIREKKAGKLGQFIIWRNPDVVEIRLKWRYIDRQYELSTWRRGENKVSGYGHIHEIIANRKIRPDFFKQYKFGLAVGPAWYYLGWKINSHLFGIHPKLFDFHVPQVLFIPEALLDALWLLFMLEVQAKIKVARCKHCGEWFEMERRSKAYCGNNCRRLAFYHKTKSSIKGDTP
ncbi:hypothetical protein ACFLY3_03405 [Chloroflexota bacterium]